MMYSSTAHTRPNMYAALLTVSIGLAISEAGISDRKPYQLNTALPKTKSLQYVFAFFRHGIRYPVGMPYPNDPYKSKYPLLFPGIPGKLTKIGKQEMYRVGKSLKTRYGDYVGDYTEEKVHVSATNFTSRTTVTALCVMAGQFPPYKPIFKDLENWQPIVVWQNTTDFDKTYLISDITLASQVCPRLATIERTAMEKAGRPDPTKERQLIYKLLQNFTGNPNLNSVLLASGIFDTLMFESLNGLPLPAWATQPQPQYQNRPLYPDLLEPIALEFFFDLVNEDILPLYAGPLLNEVDKQLERNAIASEERYRFHATHDSALFALLEGLGVEPKSIIEPGDGIIFEVHKESNSLNVEVLYYHAKNDNIDRVVLPSCPTPCTISNFIKATPGITHQQFQQRCNM